MAQHLLVVGGNGFLGSNVCRGAVAKGWKVTSISKSGNPYLTPSGHSPAWTNQVSWNAASANEPKTYAHLLPGVTSVVQTVGILLEGNYKGGIGGALSALVNAHSPNPLSKGTPGSYEDVNRDAAISVLDALLEVPSDVRRTFAYVSAADIFRPLIPERYITTKREAERLIQSRADQEDAHLRPLYFRPGFMFHPHTRPLSTPVASVLDLASSISACAPNFLPSPAGFLRTLSLGQAKELSPASHSMANSLETRPMHVESVARAICAAIELDTVDGVIDVDEMRELIGWDKSRKDSPEAPAPESPLTNNV
ncbi:NADP-binding protein [Dacryopinax primogenitus]|uniref:NADP-binding protein n=1 Tax=Dacryopinax primogenitus (strain DJM 731) TaxID=1858805 RepID=M5G9T0_DACPD|nr:NADP-binding protein [Dacryopinax primogenitus]EJU05569.1 NADP-binding protein [Dacryopinax primogenitus]